MSVRPPLLARRSIVIDLPDDPSSQAHDAAEIWVAADLRPLGQAKSDLLAGYDAACAASERQMFHGGPKAKLFRGAKQDQVRGFFRFG